MRVEATKRRERERRRPNGYEIKQGFSLLYVYIGMRVDSGLGFIRWVR